MSTYLDNLLSLVADVAGCASNTGQSVYIQSAHAFDKVTEEARDLGADSVLQHFTEGPQGGSDVSLSSSLDFLFWSVFEDQASAFGHCASWKTMQKKTQFS